MTVASKIEDRIADAPLSAHLATSVEDRPHVAPVWYVYEDGSLWVLTGGKKLGNVRHNPLVAVSIEEGAGEDVEWGVTLLGQARIVDDVDRIVGVQTAMDAKYHGEASEESVTDVPDDVEWALLEIEIGSASLQVY